jgi:hypothetical protein
MNPYQKLPSSSFWKKTVQNSNLDGIYRKKFDISYADKIGTAGSCFAQEISKGLLENGYQLFDVEPFHFDVPREISSRFGYGIYSARYSNIYTSASLLQLLKESLGLLDLSPYSVWATKNQKFCDAFRPTIEPDNFATIEEVLVHRKFHLSRVRKLFSELDVFIFTMGLTEQWCDFNNIFYPLCPGVSGGIFDSKIYKFINLSYTDIYGEMREFIEILKSINKNCKILLTVSPVPLVATASGQHVLSATIYSKSILRTVAGKLYEEFEFVDYFPSYEIAINPWLQNDYWEDNMRGVKRELVNKILTQFFDQHPPSPIPNTSSNIAPQEYTPPKCEEILLNKFIR